MKRVWIRVGIALAVLSGSLPPSIAQDPASAPRQAWGGVDRPLIAEPLVQIQTAASVRLRMQLDRSSAHVAEPIQLRLEFEAPRDTSVVLPEVQERLPTWLCQQFEVVRDLPVADGNDLRRWLWVGSIESLQTGKQTIPAIEVAYQLPDQEQAERISTEPVDVEILSVLEPDDQPTEPRSIKGPVALPPDEPAAGAASWWLMGLGSLLALAAGWFMYRRRPRPDPIALARERVAAVESAYQNQTLSLPEAYTHLSDCLRGLIQSQWRLSAMSLSTEELLATLNRQVESSSQVGAALASLKQFLESADRVRFGGSSVTGEDAFDAFDGARNLIEQLGNPQPFDSAREAT